MQLCYQTYGCLNEARDNAIIVCHWLTGNASVEQWWGKLLGNDCSVIPPLQLPYLCIITLGPRKALDTERDFIICANTLGSCYGSSGTASLNPATSEVYGTSFPQVNKHVLYTPRRCDPLYIFPFGMQVTIRDAVRAQVRLVREHLGVRGVKCVLGGSMGKNGAILQNASCCCRHISLSNCH
jgi:homoserine O-acetyltransferase